MTPEEIFKDPAFLNLPLTEQQKVMVGVDPMFKALSQPEQIKVLQGLGSSSTKFDEPTPINPLADMGMEGGAAYWQSPPIQKADLSQFLGNRIQDVGLMASSMAAAKAPLPVGMALTGMGNAIGGNLYRAYTGQGRERQITPEENALMEQGLPMVTGAELKDFGLGEGLEVAGRGVAKIASKILAPAAGKITEGMKSGIEWLKEKQLPFSADVAETGVGKVSQGVADWLGFGRLYTHNQRAKLAQGLTETVQDISAEIGMPAKQTTQDAAYQIANFMQGISQKGPYYENFNKLVKSIPETRWANTLDAIDALGKRIEGDLAASYNQGLKNIKNVYGGKRGKDLVNGLQDLINKDGIATGEEAISIMNKLWNATKYENLSGTGANLVQRLKEGFMTDMETMIAPGTGESLATIRATADKATHEALKWLENSQLTGKFLWTQLQGGRKVYQVGSERRIESGLADMLTQVTKNDVLELKQRMINAGQPELWDATKLAYLQKVFDNSMAKDMFSPTKFMKWYDKNAQLVGEVMPELVPPLQQWANISTVVGKDIQRYQGGMGQLAGSLTIGMGLGGLEAFRSGDYSKLISVPAAFSTLAALGTMSGNLAFLRKWALKETSPIAAPAIGYGARIGGLELIKERMKESQ